MSYVITFRVEYDFDVTIPSLPEPEEGGIQTEEDLVQWVRDQSVVNHEFDIRKTHSSSDGSSHSWLEPYTTHPGDHDLDEVDTRATGLIWESDDNSQRQILWTEGVQHG